MHAASVIAVKAEPSKGGSLDWRVMAGEAVAAGAAGLVYLRVEADGGIDAAKPVKEGLSEQQYQALLASTGAQPVRMSPLSFLRIVPVTCCCSNAACYNILNRYKRCQVQDLEGVPHQAWAVAG